MTTKTERTAGYIADIVRVSSKHFPRDRFVAVSVGRNILLNLASKW